MTEGEKIEEMAREIAEYFRQDCRDIPFSAIRKINKDGICEANVPTCLSCKTARLLFAAGYRKQTYGKWMVCGIFDDIFKCSVCGKEYTVFEAAEHNFCPNCGAKMKGGTEQ